MDRKFKFIRFLAWFLLTLVVVEVTFYATMAVTDKLSDENHIYELLFAFGTPILIFLWAIVFLQYLEYVFIYRGLKNENLHYLGKDSPFYNFILFEKMLKRLPQPEKGAEYYILSFTPCSQELVNSTSVNAIIVKFNGLISDMLMEYFPKHRVYARHDAAYCYSRGSFNIFLQGDENRIGRILRELETKIYNIAKDNDIRIFVQPFFGITVYNRKDDLTFALENASLARNQAEKNFELSSFYDPNLRNESLLNDSKEITDALAAKEFVVYYQPKFSLQLNRFVGSEALVRWNSPKHGFLNPGQFIDKAEKSGIIHEIDMYVFDKVCEDLNESKRRGRRILPVSINFSLYEFFSPNFVEDIVGIIDKNNIPHGLIEIEITESTTQSNPFLAISIMKKIKKAGLRVLMDDFGVGFSNFSNLRKMPIDALKIDKSFVDQITTDVKSREIMRFLINLGKASGLEVIAEGVDNEDQVEILSKCKLDTIQGYYYSKPLSYKDYNELLRSNIYENTDRRYEA